MAHTILKFKNREEWLQSRTLGIGASEVGTLLGLNPFETPYQLWRRKKGLDGPKQENNAMIMGHLFEDAVAQMFAAQTDAKIIKNSVDDFTIYDNDRPYMRVSPDRVYWNKDTKHNEKNKRLLECKTTLLTIDGDNPPKSWFCQLQYQLGVSGYNYGSLAWIMLNKREFDYRTYAFDDEFFEFIVGKVDEFWNRYIVGNEEPIAYRVSDTIIKYPKEEKGKSIELTESLSDAIEDLRSVKEKISALEAKKKQDEAIIKMEMKDAESIISGDEIVATWKANKAGTRRFVLI